MPDQGSSANPALTRRVLLGGGLAVAAAGIWWQVSNGMVPDTAPLLDYVCDQTIPATDTPGALAVKVPAFVHLALESGMAGAKGDEMIRLARELDDAAGGDFMKLHEPQRLAALTRHDEACFATHESAGKFAWPLIKKLILMGYYTSEVGGSRELQYNLDPGGYHGDLPYKKGDRAQSTDWFGVLT